MPRISRSRTSARTRKLLQPLHPGQHERSRCAARWSRSGGSAAPSSGPRTRWRASRPARGCGRSRSGTGPAPTASACRCGPGSRGSRASPAARPARRSRDPRPCASRRARAGSSPRSASASRSPSVEHAGLAEAAVLLERLHRGDRAVAEFAVGRPGIVIGPVEVELDGGALRDRHAGVGAGRRRLRLLASPFLVSSLLCGAAFFFASAQPSARRVGRRRSACAADRPAAARPPTAATDTMSPPKRMHQPQPCNAPQQP